MRLNSTKLCFYSRSLTGCLCRAAETLLTCCWDQTYPGHSRKPASQIIRFYKQRILFISQYRPAETTYWLNGEKKFACKFRHPPVTLCWAVANSPSWLPRPHSAHSCASASILERRSGRPARPTTDRSSPSLEKSTIRHQADAHS